jgi:LysR family transcriptional regulator (chromosome initiation inhibitor)
MSIDSSQLATFAAVVDEGTFEAAARALHITPSAVSQRIKALEQAVGQVLVRRTKPCRATDAGQPLLRLAGQVALLETEAVNAARSQIGGGRVRTRMAVVVNADSLATWFLPALTSMTDPAVSFDLREDDQDHTAEMLRDGTVMAAVTAENVAVQGCRIERLGAMRYFAAASPALADHAFPNGPTPTALAATPMIVFDRKDKLQHRFVRSVTRRRLDPPIHYVPSAAAYYESIRLGMGWGMVPEQLAVDEFAAGRYVRLDGRRHLDVPLYWQHWRLESAALRALTESVLGAAAASLR